MDTMILIIASATLFYGSTALCARRALKKKMETPSRWYGSSDLTYSNWLRERTEGGGESRILGIQIGLNLPQSVSVFIRVSAMPEPIGLLDTRLGSSKTFVLNESLRNHFSASLSSPTSEYSRSIGQITQASLASTLQYDRGAATVSGTIYGTRAYYSKDPEPIIDSGLSLRPVKKPKKTKKRPPTVSPLTSDFVFDEAIYFTRFDRLLGSAMDLSYRFNSEWGINSSGALTQSIFSSDETIWTSEVTLVQTTYSRKSWSISASAGLLESTSVPHWPQYKTYAVGIVYSFPN